MGVSFFNSQASGIWQAARQALTWVSLPFVLAHAAGARPSPNWAPQLLARAQLKRTPITTRHPQSPVLDGARKQCSKSSSQVSSARLKILREFEPGMSPTYAGRMVISGRMADVCAELERMASPAAPPWH